MPRVGKTIRVDGRQVHVIEEGEGTPVVLLHGCGSLAEEILAGFDRHCAGLRLIAVDRPGYGGSAPLPGGLAGPDAQADWLDGVMAALGIGPAIVAGHSYGASTALFLATRHPERVSGLMLIAPFCRPVRHAAMPLMRMAMLPVVGGFLKRAVIAPLGPLLGPGRMAAALHPNPVPEALATFPYDLATRPVAVSAMAAELLAFNDAVAALGTEASSIAVPVTVVTGQEDEIAPPGWHADWLSDLIAGVERVDLDRSGHAPHHVGPAVADRLLALARRTGRGAADEDAGGEATEGLPTDAEVTAA